MAAPLRQLTQYTSNTITTLALVAELTNIRSIGGHQQRRAVQRRHRLAAPVLGPIGVAHAAVGIQGPRCASRLRSLRDAPWSELRADEIATVLRARGTIGTLAQPASTMHGRHATTRCVPTMV
jgi:hypothetical protein